MSVFHTNDLRTLQGFPERRDQLAIVERTPLDGGQAFFRDLVRTPFRIIGQVSKGSSMEEIHSLLEADVPEALQRYPFYRRWVADMAQICDIFCDTIDSESVGFCLSTSRGCRRYHIDNVPLRLLVTYAGQGTEWIPDEAAERAALMNGAPNEDIVKDPSKRQFINAWDVAVFRGGPKGLLHRTPDAALNGPSIMMRLDHEAFWKNIFKQWRRVNANNKMAVAGA